MLQIVTAVRYAMYYYFGAFLYEKKIKPNSGLTILSMSFSVGGFVLSTQLAGSNYFVLKALNIVVSSFTSFAGIFMIYGFANLIGSREDSKIWGMLKKNSFGIDSSSSNNSTAMKFDKTKSFGYHPNKIKIQNNNNNK